MIPFESRQHVHKINFTNKPKSRKIIRTKNTKKNGPQSPFRSALPSVGLLSISMSGGNGEWAKKEGKYILPVITNQLEIHLLNRSSVSGKRRGRNE